VGCVIFPGKELRRYTYDQMLESNFRVPVNVIVLFAYSRAGSEITIDMFHEEIEKVFLKSKMFSFPQDGLFGASPYQLVILLTSSRNADLEMISGLLSGFTLTLLPGYAREELILTVDVVERGKVLKQYQYKHSIYLWIQLFLIFLMPTHHPSKVARQAVDDLLMNFLNDASKDRIFTIGLPEKV